MYIHSMTETKFKSSGVKIIQRNQLFKNEKKKKTLKLKLELRSKNRSLRVFTTRYLVSRDVNINIYQKIIKI